MTNTVLILGASGKIGRHAAQAFQAAGWQIRIFDRSKDDMTSAAIGADVIVNGLNPPNYHDWARLIPEITAQVIAAARASGASVILPGNVYNFGNTPGMWSQNTPHRPVSRKGKIRVEMEQTYRASGIQTIVLRAGNFIDPEGQDDVMDLLLLRDIKKGKVIFAGDPNVRQAFCYLPDWAQVAVMLAEERDLLAKFEDVPLPGHSFTVSDLHSALERELGRKLKLAGFPWWAMSLASPFWELARELKEMRYLWNTDHILSGEKLARLLPEFEPTDIRAVMKASLSGKIDPDQTMPGGSRVSFA